MDHPMKLSSPKRRSDSAGTWYPYYAGFSESFANDVLRHLGVRKQSTILDPWNGSGTTTAAAKSLGLDAIGLDINPALIVVAKSRVLDRTTKNSLRSIAAEILENSRECRTEIQEDDGLRQWFDRRTATHVRALEIATYRLLVDHSQYTAPYSQSPFPDMSSLAALFYVALFVTTRAFMSSFLGSNPAWVRTAGPREERVSVSLKDIKRQYLLSVSRLAELVDKRVGSESGTKCILGPGDSTNISLPDASVNAVVTSPPYCTRLDYVIATLPELALLGAPPKEGLKSLRDAMIGTPTMAARNQEANPLESKTRTRVLRRIKAHNSKASQGYYLRYFEQYFHALSASFLELNRVLRRRGRAVMVVQDSYYKDVYVNLPRIASESLRSMGWSSIAKRHFSVLNPLALIHGAARDHRDNFAARESVLIFQKP